MKPKKTDVIRVRVEPAWKYELEVFARFKKLDVADVVRIACDELQAKHSGKPKTEHLLLNAA